MIPVTSEAEAGVISVQGIHMWFGATHALDDVNLETHSGEVLGIVGTNGAGKSTLIKVLSGVHQPTSGRIEIGGEASVLESPIAAIRAGIDAVHQNIDHGVIPGMSVAENLTLDSFADRSIPLWVSARRVDERAARIAAGLSLEFDLRAPVESLSASQRQQLIIARALSRQPRLLILDEPTSTLSSGEVDVLFAVVRRLAAAGVSVIYISHYLGEIERICDRVAVLRDGRLQGMFERGFTRSELVEAMLGELLAVSSLEHGTAGAAVLELIGVRALPGARPVDLTVRRGEVLGITGLVASGKTELLQQVFGVRPLISGTMRLQGQAYAPSDPHDAVRAGVALVPEERGNDAIIPGWSVTRNVTLPYLNRYQVLGGLMNTASERDVCESLGHRMSLIYPGPEAPIESLSGGNQQKVIVARWLQGDAELLILDEPFRGIDVGARRDIGTELRRSARDHAVIVASSDPEEILEVADRIVVMAGGEVVGELASTDATTKGLAEMMSGGSAT